MNPWARNAIKGHMGASLQSMRRLRGELMGATTVATFGPAIIGMGDLLDAEMGWLRSLDPVPDAKLRSREAAFLALYGRYVVAALSALAEASRKRPLEPEAFKPFGVALLTLMTHADAARSL